MRRKDQRGYALPEVIVAAVILGMLLAPLAFLFGSTRQMGFSAGQRSKAVALARSYLEKATSAEWDSLAPAPEAPDPDYPEFTVQVDVVPRSGRDDLKDVTVFVRWQETAGRTGAVQLTTALRHRR